jgi:magnesium transporter
MRKKIHRHKKIRKKGMPPGTLVYTGHRSDKPSTVTTMHWGELYCDEVPEYYPSPKAEHGVLWVDVRSLTDTQIIGRIGSDFGIHPLALEDVLDTQQRAKLEEFDNGLFFILPNLTYNPETLELVSEQISIFFGKNAVVSFQEDPDDTFHSVRKRSHEGLGRLRKKGSDYLAYTLVDTVVDGYYLVLDEVQTQLFDLEENLHLLGAEQALKARIFDLKRVVNECRHRVLPLRDAVTRFYRTESDLVDDSNRLYLRDVVDHVAQVLDNIDNQRDTLASMEALFHAEAANRLNNVMRLLTVISTIFIPLSFIASVYGMNFDHMPELRTRYGYYIVLGVMFCAMLGMLAYFRRNRWI